MFHPEMFVSISLTWRCFSRCWYCSSGPRACPTGQHIETPALLGFFDTLLRAVKEGLIKSITEIKYTGGGEPLNHEDLVEIAVGGTQFGCNTSMLTAGASNSAMAKRLGAIKGLIRELRIAHDVESEASFERMRRTLQCTLPDSEIFSMISPDRPGYYITRAFGRIWQLAESLDYDCREIAAKTSHGLVRVGSMFTGHGNLVAHSIDRIEPVGNALPRLEHFKKKLRLGGCASVNTPGAMDLHILPEGFLTYCCCRRAKPVQPMTYDGLVGLIKGFPAAAKCVRKGLRAKAGTDVYHECDACPLYD